MTPLFFQHLSSTFPHMIESFMLVFPEGMPFRVYSIHCPRVGMIFLVLAKGTPLESRRIRPSSSFRGTGSPSLSRSMSGTDKTSPLAALSYFALGNRYI